MVLYIRQQGKGDTQKYVILLRILLASSTAFPVPVLRDSPFSQPHHQHTRTHTHTHTTCLLQEERQRFADARAATKTAFAALRARHENEQQKALSSAADAAADLADAKQAVSRVAAVLHTHKHATPLLTQSLTRSCPHSLTSECIHSLAYAWPLTWILKCGCIIAQTLCLSGSFVSLTIWSSVRLSIHSSLCCPYSSDRTSNPRSSWTSLRFVKPL